MVKQGTTWEAQAEKQRDSSVTGQVTASTKRHVVVFHTEYKSFFCERFEHSTTTTAAAATVVVWVVLCLR